MKKTAVLLYLVLVFGANAWAQGSGMINVYVEDFQLDAENVDQGKNLRPGLLRNLRPGILQRDKDPVEEAQHLTDLLAESLVDELNDKEDFSASRIAPTETMPVSGGWLVQGEFLEAGEGDQLRRAVIGFGSGAVQMQVKVTISEFSPQGEKELSVFDSSSSSGKGPGGLAPAIVMHNPYVLAGKFVINRFSPELEIRKLAKQIASGIQQYLQQQSRHSQY